MTNRSCLAAALIAIGLLAGGCGGDSGSEPGGPAPAEEEPAEDGGIYD